MKKILLNGVDGNFGSRSARVLLDKWALKPELPILTMRKN